MMKCVWLGVIGGFSNVGFFILLFYRKLRILGAMSLSETYGVAGLF